MKKYLFVGTMYLAQFLSLTIGITFALFSDIATSTGNTFAAAAEFPQACVQPNTGSYSIFANQSGSGANVVDISGSSNKINGKTHSNRDVVVGGSSNTFSRTVSYVTGSAPGGSNTYSGTPGTQNVGIQSPPVTFNIADYQPGGTRAVAAGADYHSVTGDLELKAPEVSQGGLWYINGNAKIGESNLTSPAKGITIVATGTIEVSGSQQFFSYFTDNLLFLSGKTDTSSSPVIKTAGSGSSSTSPNTYNGIIYALNGLIEFSGSNAVYGAVVIGDRIKQGGSNLTFSLFQAACPGNVVVNELNWAGNNSTADDEWIELKNTTSSPIDISGWKLEGAASGSNVVIIPSGTIPANGFFLLSNFNSSTSKINISPDYVAEAIQLDNNDQQVVLKDIASDIIDTADDNSGAPFAGSNDAPKKSMERITPPGNGTQSANWQTATTHTNMDGAGVTDEFGTPKAANGL